MLIKPFVYSLILHLLSTYFTLSTVDTGSVKIKRTQLLPPKQTFHVRGRAVRDIHVITLWQETSGVQKSQSRDGVPKDFQKRGVRWFLQMTGEWHLEP